jgi:hypothetical protein
MYVMQQFVTAVPFASHYSHSPIRSPTFKGNTADRKYPL